MECRKASRMQRFVAAAVLSIALAAPIAGAVPSGGGHDVAGSGGTGAVAGGGAYQHAVAYGAGYNGHAVAYGAGVNHDPRADA